MSKSKGNVIDPLGVAEQYGTDAVRMALLSGNAAGTDPVISEDKIKGYRNFTTKIWNMAKFVLKAQEGARAAGARDAETVKELESCKQEITGYFNEYKLHLAAETAYHYTWHTVADRIIEESKTGAIGADVLMTVFKESIKMLHPFMPFVTEEIWSKLPGTKNLLIVESWD